MLSTVLSYHICGNTLHLYTKIINEDSGSICLAILFVLHKLPYLFPQLHYNFCMPLSCRLPTTWISRGYWTSSAAQWQKQSEAKILKQIRRTFHASDPSNIQPYPPPHTPQDTEQATQTHKQSRETAV